jgi:hypothetical protein
VKLLIPFLSLSTRIFARPDLLTYNLLPTYFVPTKLASSGFSVLFCRLYFIATSGVCLIRSGTVGFQKKLQSQKKNSSACASRAASGAALSSLEHGRSR